MGERNGVYTGQMTCLEYVDNPNSARSPSYLLPKHTGLSTSRQRNIMNVNSHQVMKIRILAGHPVHPQSWLGPLGADGTVLAGVSAVALPRGTARGSRTTVQRPARPAHPRPVCSSGGSCTRGLSVHQDWSSSANSSLLFKYIINVNHRV